MKNKKIIIILLLICAGIAVYSIFSMSGTGVITPYVSFKTAMELGNQVQVIGKPNMSKPVTYEEGYVAFRLNDKDGVPMNVIYRGAKPANFEKADQVVLQGIYNNKKAVFEAEKLLVKCPSKYKKAN